MAQPRPHLSKAPAREALIDIRFEPVLPIEVLDRFIALARPSFESQLDLVEAVFGLGPAGATPTKGQQIVGRRLDSVTSHYVLQCRPGIFTLSRLSPYGEWADLRAEARKWWDVLGGLSGPQTVVRIAVRYINAIKIPLPLTDFGEYLTCPPRVPDGLPQGVSGFLHRVIVPDEKNNSTSVITQALESQPDLADGSSVTILLDLDVFRMTTIGPERQAEVWTSLDELREQKNRLFFAHLTEKTVEMFL